MTMLPNSLAFHTDGGRQCVRKQNDCVGLGAWFPLALLWGWRLESQQPETRHQGQQSKDGSGWGLGDLGNSHPSPGLWSPCFPDLFKKKKNCGEGSVLAAENKSWLTRLSMADPDSLIGTDGIPCNFSWRWTVRKSMVAQKVTSITFKSNSFPLSDHEEDV